MEKLKVGRGFTASWTVQIRDTYGNPLTGYYAGTETLGLKISDLLGNAISLIGSTVAWLSGPLGTVTLTTDYTDTSSMGPGPRGLTIFVTEGSEPVEVYHAELRVGPRPM